VTATDASGERRYPARQIISTIPLPSLVRSISPPAPADVLDAAGRLRYRAMILIYLVLETDRFTEYDAHYFPGPEIAITRVSEPKHYGLAGPSGTTVLCAELPCSTSEPVWSLGEPALRDLVCDALIRADLPIRAPIRRVVTRRLSHAYPIYLRGYRAQFDLLDAWIDQLEGIVTLGRQGLFAHDNTHHTLAMAYAAAECLDDGGTLDRARWRDHRRDFEAHVVED
jgi:protoporphyrinogen oxidase